ncbi:hemerythrin domain-containing protein [Actinoplanes palleronii]|uniref:Hemerythrin n=1 Tax=Actinoplanes palleronii TaxID=113570 RepID=A0ABQ4BLG0_9ACTN|nr:hemerythrin domain-containing protein [Actinoplanes palleronii]GIE71514.1 hemerythrin [Actinoplanes palleronii]
MSDVNLPPLPPIGDTISGRSVVDVLSEQHRELISLGARALADDSAKVRSVLIATLSRHLSAEEQYLYPAVRTAVPDGDRIADRELAEDRELLTLMQDENRLAEIVAAVERHVEADAGELFPLLEQMVPAEDMIRLGNRVEMAAEAAPTRPHPRSPVSPPWNKLVDPLLGVIDKVRDVATSRTTYARDL